MLIVSNSLGTDHFLFAVSEVRTALLKMDGQDGPVSGGDSSGFPAVRVRFSVGLSRVLLIRADGGTGGRGDGRLAPEGRVAVVRQHVGAG